MSFYIFANVSDANSCQAAVDTALGYPKAGVDYNGGLHAPPAQSVTTTYAQVQVHPQNALEHIYPADAVTTPILTVGPTAVLLGVPAVVSFPTVNVMANVVMANVVTG